MPPAGAAEEPVIGHAERRAGRGKLADPALTEPAVGVPGQVRELGRDDLAKLSQRAGNKGDRRALGCVLRHRGARADRFVVGMGVHKQEAATVAGFAHTGELSGGLARWPAAPRPPPGCLPGSRTGKI